MDQRYPAEVEIYGIVLAFRALKTSGPFKGVDYVHDFTTPTRMIGLGAGAVVTLTDGRVRRINRRAILLVSESNIWGFRNHRVA